MVGKFAIAPLPTSGAATGEFAHPTEPSFSLSCTRADVRARRHGMRGRGGSISAAAGAPRNVGRPLSGAPCASHALPAFGLGHRLHAMLARLHGAVRLAFPGLPPRGR